MALEPETMIATRETANYISGVTHELRALAVKSDLTFLSYLLSMAEEEAMATVRQAASGGLIAKDRRDRRAS